MSADESLLHSRIDRPRSVSPSDSDATIFYTLSPEEELKKNLEDDRWREGESHAALIKDNGRPCYPIELGLDVFDDPGQYKEVFEYWQWGRSNKRRVFSAQWCEWNKSFRYRQQRDRNVYVRCNKFHRFQDFLRERRRKHGLDGDLQLREKVAEQSPLDDWMEYQDYKLLQYEDLERRLKGAQEELVSRRKKLAEEGYPAFEEIEELEFGEYFGMNFEWDIKEGEARKKQELAERKLTIAKKRLEVARSEELGERVERDRWIGWFKKEMESRRRALNELQRAEDEADRDVEPYEQWVEARRKEWGARYDENRFKNFTKLDFARITAKEMMEYHDKRNRLFELEVETPEYRAKVQKGDELHKRACKASSTHTRAKIELRFAEEVLKPARTEDLAPIVERAALIRRIEKEIRFAEFHVEEEEESRKVLSRKWGVLSKLYKIPELKGEMKRLKALLDWVERERQEMVGDGASAKRESGPRRSTRASSRAIQSPYTTEASRVDHPVKKRARPRKPSTAKSILDPVDPAKVAKSSKKKQSTRQRTMVARDVSQAAEKTNVDSSAAGPRCDAAVPIEDGIRARLRPVHASRVSKPAPKRPIGRQKETTRPSSTKGTSKNVSGRSINASIQRSTRGSKRLQRVDSI